VNALMNPLVLAPRIWLLITIIRYCMLLKRSVRTNDLIFASSSSSDREIEIYNETVHKQFTVDY
jgi:hypothetical protein